MKLTITKAEFKDLLYGVEMAIQMEEQGPGEMIDAYAHRTMRLRARRLEKLRKKLGDQE